MDAELVESDLQQSTPTSMTSHTTKETWCSHWTFVPETYRRLDHGKTMPPHALSPVDPQPYRVAGGVVSSCIGDRDERHRKTPFGINTPPPCARIRCLRQKQPAVNARALEHMSEDVMTSLQTLVDVSIPTPIYLCCRFISAASMARRKFLKETLERVGHADFLNVGVKNLLCSGCRACVSLEVGRPISADLLPHGHVCLLKCTA